MITNVDIALTFTEIFSAIKFIADKRELTEDPTPDVQKKISDPACAHSKEEWENNTRQQNDHEDSKNKEYPNLVKCT